MKLTLPQLRKLVESTVKDVMKSKRTLREDFYDDENDGEPRCEQCGSIYIEPGETICRDCEADNEDDDQGANQPSLYQPDFEVGAGKEPSPKIGGMKAALDRHVKESRMRSRRR
jgi:hypothetical protein